MRKEIFDIAADLDKTISMMEAMKKKIDMTGSINELFKSELVSAYGNRIDQYFRGQFLEWINTKLEHLKKEFESL